MQIQKEKSEKLLDMLIKESMKKEQMFNLRKSKAVSKREAQKFECTQESERCFLETK